MFTSRDYSGDAGSIVVTSDGATQRTIACSCCWVTPMTPAGANVADDDPQPRGRRHKGERVIDAGSSALESISGHLSRLMLEHYPHIRIDAKRQALDALDATRRAARKNGDGDDNGNGNAERKTRATLTPSSRCPTS